MSSFVKKKYRVSTGHQIFQARKGPNATEISKEEDECLHRRWFIVKCLTQYKEPERASEDSSRTAPTSTTITTDQNIQALQLIVMQTGKSLSIAKLTNCLFQEQHLMSNDLGMKKVSTHKMGTEQLSTLSTEREANPNNDFDRMVTGR